MRTRMHQEAFPDEDISDRPLPEESVPGLLELLEGDLPSGRYGARDLIRAHDAAPPDSRGSDGEGERDRLARYEDERVRGHDQILQGYARPQAEHEEPDFAVFGLPNGDKVEVFGPGDREHEHFDTGPVAGFLVTTSKRREPAWKPKGSPLSVRYTRPRTEDPGPHFVGPDGNVYELTGDRPQA